MTIAVLLVNAGLNSGKTKSTTTAAPVTSVVRSTTTTKVRGAKKRRFYAVQSGDTFGSIASKVGISIAQLQGLNPGVSSNALRVGQRLRVK